MSYGHDDHDHGHHHQDSHWGPHDWEFDYGHGVVGGAPHNSWAPIMIALDQACFCSDLPRYSPNLGMMLEMCGITRFTPPKLGCSL